MNSKFQMELINAFHTAFGRNESQAVHTFFSPGRVNLIGEHIDYNGGFVFPAALTMGIGAAVRLKPKGAKTIDLKSGLNSQTVTINLEEDIVYKAEDGWGNYVKGVFAALKAQGQKIVPCEIFFQSNLPTGSGLSSSAALEVLAGYLMQTLNKTSIIDRVKLAKMCQEVENKFVGVNCGIMDQFAVAMGKRNHAILLDCATLKYAYAPFTLSGYKLVIMNTKKPRALAESKYNERRSECEAALAEINQKAGLNLPDLCSATLEQVNEHVADPVLKKRATHVITENHRVLKAVEVLKDGNLPQFGELLNGSHQSLKEDYEVTGHHLDAIVSAAQKHPNCLGARMTGAGFGGCAIAIVESLLIDDFIGKVSSEYVVATGIHPEFYVSEIGEGVSAHS